MMIIKVIDNEVVRLTMASVEFKLGDEEVETPEGTGTIVDLAPHSMQQIGIRLDSGEIRWYSWRDVQL